MWHSRGTNWHSEGGTSSLTLPNWHLEVTEWHPEETNWHSVALTGEILRHFKWNSSEGILSGIDISQVMASKAKACGIWLVGLIDTLCDIRRQICTLKGISLTEEGFCLWSDITALVSCRSNKTHPTPYHRGLMCDVLDLSSQENSSISSHRGWSVVGAGQRDHPTISWQSLCSVTGPLSEREKMLWSKC